MLTPQLEMDSISRTSAPQLTFDALANHQPVHLIPIARATREYYTTYFQTT
jgi:hypothetical protein